jgi:ABC-type hemin transport system ATPase subunit
MRHVSEPVQESLALKAHGLTNRFGHQVTADHVELRVPRGCAFAYLGPNGAGKPVTELRRSLPPECTWHDAEFALESLGEGQLRCTM